MYILIYREAGVKKVSQIEVIDTIDKTQCEQVSMGALRILRTGYHRYEELIAKNPLTVFDAKNFFWRPMKTLRGASLGVGRHFETEKNEGDND